MRRLAQRPRRSSSAAAMNGAERGEPGTRSFQGFSAWRTPARTPAMSRNGGVSGSNPLVGFASGSAIRNGRATPGAARSPHGSASLDCRKGGVSVGSALVPPRHPYATRHVGSPRLGWTRPRYSASGSGGPVVRRSWWPTLLRPNAARPTTQSSPGGWIPSVESAAPCCHLAIGRGPADPPIPQDSHSGLLAGSRVARPVGPQGSIHHRADPVGSAPSPER